MQSHRPLDCSGAHPLSSLSLSLYSTQHAVQSAVHKAVTRALQCAAKSELQESGTGVERRRSVTGFQIEKKEEEEKKKKRRERGIGLETYDAIGRSLVAT